MRYVSNAQSYSAFGFPFVSLWSRVLMYMQIFTYNSNNMVDQSIQGPNSVLLELAFQADPLVITSTEVCPTSILSFSRRFVGLHNCKLEAKNISFELLCTDSVETLESRSLQCIFGGFQVFSTWIIRFWSANQNSALYALCQGCWQTSPGYEVAKFPDCYY